LARHKVACHEVVGHKIDRYKDAEHVYVAE